MARAGVTVDASKGATQVVPLVDAVPGPVDVSWSYPDVPAEAWTGLACAGLSPEGKFEPSLGCFLIRTPEGPVLCDAGIGPGPNDYLSGLSGHLPERLAALGVAPEEIRALIFTHLHMDHIGWAAPDEGAGWPGLPNARLIAPEADLAHFAAGAPGMGPHHASAFEARLRPALDAGRIETRAAGAEALPGFDYIDTPGHTPGHQSLLVQTGGAPVLILGDVAHCPAQIERPDWSHRADHDAPRARASRKAVLARAAEEGWQIAAGHFRAGLQMGHVERVPETTDNEAGYRYRPSSGDARTSGHPDQERRMEQGSAPRTSTGGPS